MVLTVAMSLLYSMKAVAKTNATSPVNLQRARVSTNPLDELVLYVLDDGVSLGSGVDVVTTSCCAEGTGDSVATVVRLLLDAIVEIDTVVDEGMLVLRLMILPLELRVLVDKLNVVELTTTPEPMVE